MSAHKVGFWLLALAVLACLGPGCDYPSDSAISGHVTDSVTSAPIDSVKVYASSIVGMPGSMWTEPLLRDITDADGRFFFWTSGDGVYIVEVRKEGYCEPLPQMLKGGGELNFVLVADGAP